MPTPDGAHPPPDTPKIPPKNTAPLPTSQKALHSFDKQLRELRCCEGFAGAEMLADYIFME